MNERCEERSPRGGGIEGDRSGWNKAAFCLPLEDRGWRWIADNMGGGRRVRPNGLKRDRAMVVWSVSLCCLVFLVGKVESAPPGICAMDGCNCTVKAHRWINVKCVFSNDQVNRTKSNLPFRLDQYSRETVQRLPFRFATAMITNAGNVRRKCAPDD